jgi:PAS domain S-box-containing protein
MMLEHDSNGGSTADHTPLTGVEYRLLVEHSPVMIWRADRNKKCDYFNRVWLEFTGRTMAQESGDGWAEGVHADDLARCFAIYVSNFDRRLPFEMEYRLKRGDGVYRWIFDRGVPYTDDHGEFLGYIGSCVDVTERREAEEARREAEERRRALAAEQAAHAAVAKKNAELQEMNERLEQAMAAAERARAVTEEAYRELDQFAHVASHDLKAPLRGIANLAQWIEDDAGNGLSGESAQHLRMLQGRVQRLEALIDGILAYSRAGRTKNAPEPVDSGALVREVIELLAPPPEVTIEIPEHLPTLRAERVPLQQVFLNLLGNAVKFGRTERPDVTVRLECSDLGDAVEFAVSDNGPGIAPEYHDRIWGIFQTLAPRDKIEGTGIGLSVVRKVVETRGGHVALDSAPGRGATFRFTWPKAARSGELA